MTHRTRIFAAPIFASILGIASPSQAAPYLRTEGILWSSVGTAGQVDPRSAALAQSSKAILSMSAPGVMVARFGVAPSGELASASGLLHLMANFADPGAGASVDISLVQIRVGGPDDAAVAPTSRTVLHLGSSDAAGLTGIATRCVAETNSVELDFDRNVYYIQAMLTWDASTQPKAPSLRAVQLGVYGSAICGQ